jgi:hypothetical protein
MVLIAFLTPATKRAEDNVTNLFRTRLERADVVVEANMVICDMTLPVFLAAEDHFATDELENASKRIGSPFPRMELGWPVQTGRSRRSEAVLSMVPAKSLGRLRCCRNSYQFHMSLKLKGTDLLLNVPD